MEESLEKVTDIQFHGVDYILRLYATEHILTLEIEQKTTGDIWKNSFAASYIEEITEKTGNFKKFPVFIKMLITAIFKKSDSVYLDLLTQQDLEMFKQKKQNPEKSYEQSPLNKTNTSGILKQKQSKKYMILSYIVEFDKIHYPMPLNYDDNPEVDTLKNTLKRFRMEMEEMRNVIGSSTNQQGGNINILNQSANLNDSQIVNNLRNENELLRNKAKRLEEISQQRTGAVEFDNIIKKKLDLENELELLKLNSQKEIAQLTKQLEEAERNIMEKKNEIHQLKMDFANAADDEDIKKKKNMILLKNQSTENELIEAKKQINNLQKNSSKLEQEIESLKQLDKKSKTRIKQLEMDLEQALKRTSHKGVTDRLYNNSRNNSRGSSPAQSRGISRQNSPAQSTSSRARSVPNKYSPMYNKQPYNKNTYNKTGSSNLSRGSSVKTNSSAGQPGYQRQPYKPKYTPTSSQNKYSYNNTTASRKTPPSKTTPSHNVFNRTPPNKNQFSNNYNQKNTPTGQTRPTNNTNNNKNIFQYNYNQKKPSPQQQQPAYKKPSPQAQRVTPPRTNYKPASNTYGAGPINNQNKTNTYQNKPITGNYVGNIQANKVNNSSPYGNKQTTNYSGSGQKYNNNNINQINKPKNMPAQQVLKPNQNQANIENIEDRLKNLSNLLKIAKK